MRNITELYNSYNEDGKFDQEGYNKAFDAKDAKYLSYVQQQLAKSNLTPEQVTALKKVLDLDLANVCQIMLDDQEWSDDKANLALQKQIPTVLLNDAKVLRDITRAVVIAWTESNVAVDLARKNLEDFYAVDVAITPKHDAKKALQENKDVLNLTRKGEDFELFQAHFYPIPLDFVPGQEKHYQFSDDDHNQNNPAGLLLGQRVLIL